MTESVAKTPALPWYLAALLAVLALVGGIFLGRVGFFTSVEPRPLVKTIDVLDETLTVNGSVQYLQDEEVYILRINDMPPAPTGSVYQVWMQKDETNVSVGIWNPNAVRMAYAAYSGRYDTILVTREPSPLGSTQPTTDPVITVDLTKIDVDD